MPIYGGIQERGLFEEAAERRLEEEKASAAPEGNDRPAEISRHFSGRSEALAIAQAALRGGGVSYAGEHPARVLPHPMPDDHRNYPA